MIRFKDFSPDVRLAGEGFGLEDLTTAVSKANSWIDAQGADVVNVETLLLPNIYRGGEAGSVDTMLQVSGDTDWFQLVRVWYRG